MKSNDQQIRNDVLWELKRDSRVDDLKVEVQVEEGIVTLTGRVAHYAGKKAAQEAAHHARSVLDVANDIEVHPTTECPTDTEIAKAVREALRWDALVPDDIHCTVGDGWVTLEGTVTLLRERADAAYAIHNLRGVRGIDNNLKVQVSTVGKKEIEHVIEEVLERRSNRAAKCIDVEIQGSEVTLSGTVHTWPEKHALLESISHISGVTDLKDRLVVDVTLWTDMHPSDQLQS